jgi:mannose-6-phosphate isomerase-like protein (cupin superfamily)
MKTGICAVLVGGCVALLGARRAEPPAGVPGGQGGRAGRGSAPPATYWVAKTKGGLYVPPNKPLTRLSDLKARHTGQATWTELVVKDADMQAEYNSAAPGTKISRRFHPDTRDFMVVIDGEMHFDIEGQESFDATRGSIVNIPRSTIFAYEITGSRAALWVDMNQINFQTLFPGDGPAPAAPPGAEVIKVSFSRTPGADTPPNMPHWNLFEAAKAGPPGGPRVLEDHMFANPIYGFADPNDPLNPDRRAVPENGRGAAPAPSAPFNPNSVFGHLHAGPAEWWIVQSGRITARFENTGEFVGIEGDILYAPPFMWHQMGFQGAGPSCRLAIGAYRLINMISVQGR